MKKPRSRRRRVLTIAGAVSLEALAMKLRGYPIAGNLVVRCRNGHLFTTIWLPGVSVKSIRLGWLRLQWCPVGRHFSIVTPVRPAELTDAEREAARDRKDLRLP